MGKKTWGSLARRALLLVLSAALLLCGGCGGGKGGAGSDAVFTMAVTEAPDSLNPVYAQNGTASEFFLLVYDPLWRLDAAGEPVNCLVEDYSLSSDQLTWTIRIRKDVTFSDGTPLTAEDVRFTYEQMMFNSPIYTHCFDGISGMRCPDEYTLVVTTEYVKGDMRYNPVPILPEHIWSAYINDLRAFDNELMIGSGPFQRLDVDTDPQQQSWVFQAREDYFGEPAHIGQVRFTFYETVTGAGRALSTGEVDAAIGLTDVQITTLAGVPGVDLIRAFLPSSELLVLAFNTRGEMFKSADMRRMIEYCTDRERILSMSAGEAGQSSYTWAPPGADYRLDIVNGRSFNVDTARNQLALAGYVDSDKNGFVDSIMTQKDISVKLYTSTADGWSATAATILKENVEQAGLQVDWQAVDEDVTTVCTPRGKWDMCFLSWRGSNNPVLAAQRFCPAQDSLTGWENPIYEQGFSQLQSAADPISMQNMAMQLQQVFYDDCPYIILGWHSDIQAVRSDRWSGYDQVLETAGALFGIGSADAYMSLTPGEEAKG